MMRPIPLLLTVCGGALLFFTVLLSLQEDDNEPKLVKQDIQQTKQKTPEVLQLKDSQPAPKVMENKNFKNSVKGIAKSYAQQSRFPATSMPIADEEALQKYIPNQAVGASLPFEGPEGESLRFSLRTNKYRYFEDENIDIFVSLHGASSITDAQVVISLVSERKVIYSIANGPMTMGMLKATINTKDVNTADWPKELHLQAVAMVNGETMQVVETIRYENKVATVKSVGKGKVDDDYLVIPVAIDTQEKGYFRITGVLFSESSQKPLVHLEGKAKININNDTVELKAQLRSLQVGNDEGPYQLQHLWIEKMPGPPDYETAYGIGDEETYPINAHSFDEYADSDFVDPAALRSLEFLEKIGGGIQ